MKKMIIEACVENLEEALFAERSGADQLELCSALECGGLTPSRELVKEVCRHCRIPVKVMIRPRPGNFVYSDQEIAQMKESIESMQEESVSGMVLGLLHESGEVDREKTQRLIRLAAGLPVTFHRAVDETPDPYKAVREIKETGASFILSSGQARTAIQGAALIKRMQEEAGDLTVIAAGGITVHNLLFVKQLTGARAFHGTGIVGRYDKRIPWRTI